MVRSWCLVDINLRFSPTKSPAVLLLPPLEKPFMGVDASGAPINSWLQRNLSAHCLYLSHEKVGEGVDQQWRRSWTVRLNVVSISCQQIGIVITFIIWTAGAAFIPGLGYFLIFYEDDILSFFLLFNVFFYPE